jgi:uncharacterized protein YkwD
MARIAFSRRPLLLAAAAFASLAVSFTAPSTSHVATASARTAQSVACDGADLQPTAANLPQVRAAVLCLHNKERAARGLPALRDNAKLRKAALGHSDDMVVGRFFAHDTPSGSSMVDRIRNAGYIRPLDTWTVGENIAWGTEYLATAGEIHEAWMRSPGHRANILKRSYREIGVGIVVGAPLEGTEGRAGATYTADFGVRR